MTWALKNPVMAGLLITGGTANIGSHACVKLRPGDVPLVKDCSIKAKQILGWRSKSELEAMRSDGWAWQASKTEDYRHG